MVPGTQDRVEECVRGFVEASELAHSPRTLVIGVSGGPDSLCLLYALRSVADDLGLLLHIAHLNHCLRGLDSDDDAAFVARLADNMEVPFTLGREEVRLRPSAHSSSLEEKAREARYDFLARVVKDTGASGAAVAHTADDQTETLLLHILRGSGTSGLRGMRPVSSIRTASGWRLRLYRPLLDVTRGETEAYCRALGLTPRLDRTNESTEQLRNRIRLDLIPYLRGYNPTVEDAIRRLGAAASLDMDFIEAQVDEAWHGVAMEADGSVRIFTESLGSLPPALRRHVLRRALTVLLGDLVDIEQVHIVALEELMSRPVGKRLHLPRGITVTMGYGECVLTRAGPGKALPSRLEGEHALNVPGVTIVAGWRITASVGQRPVSLARAGGLRVALDLDVAGERLTVRSRRDGDRFQPLGMRHTKKLHDFLVDSKVPRGLRDEIPLVCANGRIVWVVGWRIDERAKVTDSTTRVLEMRFERLEPVVGEGG